MSTSTWKAFRQRYEELEEVCYRAAVAGRSPRGRLRGHYRLPEPLLKKLSIDEELERLLERFFRAK